MYGVCLKNSNCPCPSLELNSATAGFYLDHPTIANFSTTYALPTLSADGCQYMRSCAQAGEHLTYYIPLDKPDDRPHLISTLASLFIYFLLQCLPYGFASILSESESPIKYTFPKTTKLTNLQKVSIFTFFTIMEVYYIYLCTWTHPSQNEYNIVKFLPGTIYLCPIINIMVIPPVVVACYAYNSDTVKLFQSQPGSELQFIGLKTWNPATGVWESDEKPEDHEFLEV
eukprot:NP_497392.2 Uncharacterized protein CELE_Y82E9BL.2 [Caenorhabditis elegans]